MRKQRLSGCGLFRENQLKIGRGILTIHPGTKQGGISSPSIGIAIILEGIALPIVCALQSVKNSDI